MCTLQCDNNSTSIGSDEEKLQNRTPLNLDPPPLPHEVNDGIVKEGSTEKEMYKVLLVSSTAHDKGRPSKRDTAKANEIKDEYVVRPCTSCVRNDENNLERQHSE